MMFRVPRLLAPIDSEDPSVTFSVRTFAPLAPVAVEQSHGCGVEPDGTEIWTDGLPVATLDMHGNGPGSRSRCNGRGGYGSTSKTYCRCGGKCVTANGEETSSTVVDPFLWRGDKRAR
jgi:hypothetical protein